MTKRFTVDSDGKWWDKKSNKYVTIDHLFYLVEKLEKENKQLKSLNIPIEEIKETVVDYKGRIIGVYYND